MRLAGDASMTIEQKRTFCRVCEPACGLVASVEDGRLVALAADKAHPVSRGFVCNKGLYGADLHNDPDRLKVPLKRLAPGRFEPVGWDEALADIAQRLRATIDHHGASAVAAYTGNPAAFNSLFGPAFGGLLAQLGVRTTFSSGTQDCTNKFAGAEAVFGTRTLHPVPDIDRADLIVLFGENPAVSHMSFVSMPHPMRRLREAQARGARIVHVNPRRTESAAMAGEHLPVRPDTDVYLLAALLHAIDRGPGFDAEAVQRHGRHVDALRAFLAPWTPERVAPVTGIPAETIRALALDFAAAPAACAHMSTGVNMGRQGTLAYWLLHMLVFVTGNLGRAGGNFYSQGFYTRSTAAGANGPRAMVDSPFGRMRQPGGVGISLPGALLADHVLNPQAPIRAMFVNSGNPVLSIAGEARLREAFASLDLLVCVDIYRNATAEYAHYILPAAGAYEREDINITGLGMQDQPSVQFTEAVVPPAFERKPEWWIYGRLAQLMGLRSALDEGEVPDLWARTDAMLRSRGQSMPALREAGVLVFERSSPESFFDMHLQTDDHRVDCCPPSFAEAIARMGTLFDALAAEPPGQLKLIGKRDPYMLNSWYGNLPKMKAQGRDHNPLFMHPDDARARRIADGDSVRVANRHGAVETRVQLTDQLMPGVVAMTHGWGQATSPGLQVAQRTAGVNCNVLMPSGPGAFEPISNQSHMTGIAVEVDPA
jgi:anaerobic selenocysteine-containing dehydrogenase